MPEKALLKLLYKVKEQKGEEKMKKFTALLLLLCLLLTFGCTGGKDLNIHSAVKEGSGLLEVHIIDVGQADAILIRTPDQGDLLIDGGTNAAEDDLLDYLASQNVQRLQAVIATHPHEDHIGGLDGVLNTYSAEIVYMPKVTHTTATFERFIKAVQNNGAKTVQAKSGVSLDLGEGGAQGIFLAPNSEEYDELNNYSAVLKLVYGDTSFMLTGDAEKLSEGEIMTQYSAKSLAADVLKVGHHGSKTSTSAEFLAAVAPQLAVISVGKDNDYGLPHPNTLTLLEKEKIPYLRTDEEGTIVIYSDGKKIALSPDELEATQVSATPIQPLPTTDNDTKQTNVIIESVDRKAEIAQIRNEGDNDVDLSGWVLVSVQGDQRYTFAEGTILKAGESLAVLSGSNAKADIGQVVWTEKNIWNNDYDPAELYDAAGQLVSSLE